MRGRPSKFFLLPSLHFFFSKPKAPLFFERRESGRSNPSTFCRSMNAGLSGKKKCGVQTALVFFFFLFPLCVSCITKKENGVEKGERIKGRAHRSQEGRKCTATNGANQTASFFFSTRTRRPLAAFFLFSLLVFRQTEISPNAGKGNKRDFSFVAGFFFLHRAGCGRFAWGDITLVAVVVLDVVLDVVVAAVVVVWTMTERVDRDTYFDAIADRDVWQTRCG